MQNSEMRMVGTAFTGDLVSSREIISANLVRIGVTQEERYQLILHEVYRCVEQKGFHSEITLQDWLVAEAHIDEMIDKMAAEGILRH
jgi:hypothetical protein